MEKVAEEKTMKLAKKYQSMLIMTHGEITPELTELGNEIRENMGTMPQDEMMDFVSGVRYDSIAVNGQEPQTHTGYGIIRETFCSILTDKLLMDTTNITYSLQQGGQSNQIQDISDQIYSTMRALPKDQFEVLHAQLLSYAPPTHNNGIQLSQNALNRSQYALNYLKEIETRVYDERIRSEKGLDSEGMDDDGMGGM